MPKKRYHKKSRAGCDTCKRRRVKCDEVTPVCGNCAQRKDRCTYSHTTGVISTTRPKDRHSSKGASTTTTSRSSSPEQIHFSPASLFDANGEPSPRLFNYNATRMKELQLMHQWSTVTYKTSGPRDMEIFRDWTVKKALEHPYLMDILLAFTSLHSASEAAGPSEAYEHVTAALHFQNQSIAELNRGQSVLKVTPETCEPIFVVTGLNGVCTLLANLVPARSGEQLDSISEVLLRVQRCMLGVNEVIAHCKGWAEDGELASMFNSPHVPRFEDQSSVTADDVRCLSDCVVNKMDLDSSATPYLRSTMQKMEKAFADNKGRSVFGWLVMVEAEFFYKVGLGETVAMVILACWGALTCALEEVWWTKYAGKRIVEDLSVQLMGCDSRWDDILHWCREQVGMLESV